MQYVGGKSKIARRLAAVMLAETPDRWSYFEPFVGGGAVLGEMAPHFDMVAASDIHADLICMFRAVQGGWVPPSEVSEAEYGALKANKAPSPLRGFVGFACSFGGKWFGGYARSSKVACVAEWGSSSLRKMAPKIAGVRFSQGDYADLSIPLDAVVYCDPPYAGTQGYATGDFDHEAFWQWATKLSSRCTVFVSEYAAPPGWVSLWEREQPGYLAGAKLGYKKATEHLFVYRPRQGE